jgi:hypothetical protein
MPAAADRSVTHERGRAVGALLPAPKQPGQGSPHLAGLLRFHAADPAAVPTRRWLARPTAAPQGTPRAGRSGPAGRGGWRHLFGDDPEQLGETVTQDAAAPELAPAVGGPQTVEGENRQGREGDKQRLHGIGSVRVAGGAKAVGMWPSAGRTGKPSDLGIEGPTAANLTLRSEASRLRSGHPRRRKHSSRFGVVKWRAALAGAGGAGLPTLAKSRT